MFRTDKPSQVIWCPVGCDKLELLSASSPEVSALQYLDTYWVSFITAGEAQAKYQRQRYELHPGSLHIYQAGAALSLRPSKTASYYLLRVSPTLLRHYLPTHDVGNAYEQFGPSPDVPKTSPLYPSALELFNKFSSGHSAFRNHLKHFVAQLAGHFQKALLASEAATEEPSLVRLIKTHLQTNYARPVSYAELSALTGRSKSHILRQFKEATGLTPHLYRTSWRVSAAKALLRRGLPLATTATDLGFADQPHLTRTFKRYVGVTPGHYQQSVRYELSSAA